MECFRCDSELLNTETTFAKEYDDRVIVIKKIPALKCEKCGEEYFEPKENDNISKIVLEFLNDTTQDTDVIFDYKKIINI
ncbi:MAG TPA: YgiT-type zinc finger protein [Tissierellaceae bacterium]